MTWPLLRLLAPWLAGGAFLLGGWFWHNQAVRTSFDAGAASIQSLWDADTAAEAAIVREVGVSYQRSVARSKETHETALRLAGQRTSRLSLELERLRRALPPDSPGSGPGSSSAPLDSPEHRPPLREFLVECAGLVAEGERLLGQAAAQINGLLEYSQGLQSAEPAPLLEKAPQP